MSERIFIYGVNKKEFPTAQALIDYLSTDLFNFEEGRFRYTQCKNADIIILSLNGLACGHLIVTDNVNPSVEDRIKLKPAKCTYLVSDSVAYHNPVRLFNDLGILVTSFGTRITREKFLEIQERAI
jgi:hypothetical protein